MDGVTAPPQQQPQPAGGEGEWGDAALPPLVEGELAGMPMEELTRRCVGVWTTVGVRGRRCLHAWDAWG